MRAFGGTIDRRTTLRRALLGAFALIGLRGAGDALDPTLSSLARQAGLRFGSAARAASLSDPNLATLHTSECDTLTPEIEMKWNALSPAPGQFNSSGADALAAFARAKGLRLRGHTMLWHGGLPGWFNAETPWNAVRGHIGAVVTRYGSLIDEWDVVNEPIVAGGPRDSVLLRAFGPDYVERALREAHAVAPKARLMINEYDLEYPSIEQTDRRGALLALIGSLQRAGAPLHGIGLQAHLSLAEGPIDATVLSDFLAALADLGLSISITELDVKEVDYIAPVEVRDAAVADHAARFLDVVLAQPAVTSLTCWGLSDRQSWLQVTEEDRARFPGAWRDGTSPGFNRGLPYDASLNPKPMRSALQTAFASKRKQR